MSNRRRDGYFTIIVALVVADLAWILFSASLKLCIKIFFLFYNFLYKQYLFQHLL